MNLNNNSVRSTSISDSNPLMSYNNNTPAEWNDIDDITRPIESGPPTVPMNKDPYLQGRDMYDDWDNEVIEGGVQENSVPSLQNSRLNDNRRLS